MIVRGLDHVSVTVADIDRSLVFYHDLLGIPLLGRGEDDGPPLPGPNGTIRTRFLYADLRIGAGQILELLHFLVPHGKPSRSAVYDPGSGHIGIRVGNLDATLELLRKSGVNPRFDPISLDSPSWWAGARVVYVFDPDGTTVELVERASTRTR